MNAADLKIMIVDDARTMRAVVKKCFLSLGVKEIQEAADGQAALQMIQQCYTAGGNLDLILTDIMMPVMDGVTLVKRIKELPQAAKVPIVVLTAEDDEQKMAEMRSAGAKAYLIKPPELHVISKVLLRLYPGLLLTKSS